MIINKIYGFLIIRLGEPLSKINNFSNIIQGMGLALLTILIPLAIAVLADVYQKRKEDEKEYTYLDLHVILDNVFNIKLLIFSVFLIFLPIFFWEILTGLYKLIAVPFIFIGIILLVNIIFKVYRWIKGNIFDFRFSYLRKLNRYNDLEIVWKSIWEVTKINIKNERKFLQIFSSAIDRLLNLTEKSENLKTISKLLNDFYNFINNRSIAALNEDIFPKIIDWHFNFWRKEYELLDKKSKLDKWSNYREISRILNDIFNNIEERSLKERMAYSFFEHFKKHVKDYKKVLVKDANKKDYYRRYINSLFTTFHRVFFENIEKSPEKHDIWEFCFPEEWKITKNNLENKENIISKILLKKYVQWGQVRIIQAKEDLDWDLDNISRNLFPEVGPILWAMILIFIFSPYGDNRMKSVIERPWTFGLMGRFRIYSGDIEVSKEESNKKNEEEMQLAEEAETKNTFELACLLFKEKFSKDNLEKYIKSLKELDPEYKKDPDKEKKRLRLLDAFSEMLNFLD